MSRSSIHRGSIPAQRPDGRTAPYLDPCSWRGGLLISVSANATAAQTITLAKGVFLKVRVNDPLGLLPQSVDGPLGPRKLVVGVTFGTGAFLGAQNIAVDAAGRSYQMAIPAGQALGLWLFSQDISLADSTGARVNLSGRPSPFQAMPGEDQVLGFTVTGPAVSGTLQ